MIRLRHTQTQTQPRMKLIQSNDTVPLEAQQSTEDQSKPTRPHVPYADALRLYEQQVLEEEQARIDTQMEILHDSGLEILDSVFTEFLSTVKCDAWMQTSLDMIKGKMGIFPKNTSNLILEENIVFEKRGHKYTHESVRYTVTLERAVYNGVDTLSIRLNSNGYTYPVLHQKGDDAADVLL